MHGSLQHCLWRQQQNGKCGLYLKPICLLVVGWKRQPMSGTGQHHYSAELGGSISPCQVLVSTVIVLVLGESVSPCQVLVSTIDPSTGPTQSPISTNQRREMLLFLAQIFGSHAGITNNGSAHTDSAVLSFWFNRPTVKWLYGCLQGNRLRTISSSNLYR